MPYTHKDQLQLFCIIMLAITGIEAVFFCVKMKMEVATVIQLVCIVLLYLVLCIGYHSTEKRSPTEARWFYRGIIFVEMAEVIELIVSLILRYGLDHSKGDNSNLDTLLGWEIFNVITAGIGAFLGYKHYRFLVSGAVLLTEGRLSSQLTNVVEDEATGEVTHQPIFSQL
eukprot:Sspe_Gene.17622::Locus_6266_Transcript_1_1_Confidence_1.000_Length_1317::g.17622::m.17622